MHEDVTVKSSIRAAAFVLATSGLVLSACGGSDAPVGEATLPPASIDSTVVAPALTADESETGESETVESETAPTTEASAAPAPSDTSSTDGSDSTGSTAVADAAPTETTAAAPVETAAPAAVEAVIGGRTLAGELSAASDFDGNILPDLQVDDIRRGQSVNLRNVLPAERPVLFWMWAPH